MLEKRIRRYMNENWKYCININGDVNMTTLAEDCANTIGEDSWLDDETHIVWEIATEYNN